MFVGKTRSLQGAHSAFYFFTFVGSHLANEYYPRDAMSKGDENLGYFSLANLSNLV
jgi:hypothetical protein